MRDVLADHCSQGRSVSTYRPRQVDQLDGSRYAGLNCNCAAAAMALDRHTLGEHRTTGAYVRALTGDTSGGTNLAQVKDALMRRWNVNLDVEYGLDFDAFMHRIEAGRGAILQGSCLATKGTTYQESESFAGNHSWFVNSHNDDGFLVFLPLGDARRPGITDSPRRIPKSVVYKFAGLLDLDGNGHRLGMGRVYAGFTRDTEPHVILRYGARRTMPFPDRTRASGGGNMRSAPKLAATYVVRALDTGELFIAYQVTDSGEVYKGSPRWYGNQDGNRWVHTSRLDHQGGST